MSIPKVLQTHPESPFSFTFESSNVRIVTIEEEPHLVGKDVCVALGYVDPTNAMKQHCKGVVKRHPLLTAGGMQQIRVLAEPDVLRLIVNCKLPAAQAFERLVFEEILPSIRRTGRYTPPSAAARESRDPIKSRDSRPEEPSLAAQYKAAIPVAEAVVELGTALGWTIERSQAAAVDVIQRKMGVDIGEPPQAAAAAPKRETAHVDTAPQSALQLSPLQQLEYIARRGPELFRTQIELAAASGSAQTTISRIYRRDARDRNPTAKTMQRIYEAVRRQEAIAGNPSGQMFLPLK